MLTVLDIGGTHVRWTQWSPQHGLGEVSCVSSPSFSRHARASAGELQAMLVRVMADAVPPGGVAGVSFGAALDHRTGTVYASAPLWGAHSRPFDLRTALRAARPDVRWHVVNDVTAALLHLASTPVAQGLRKIQLATISTGIACRTIDQRTGEIPVDGCGLQGEIGHLPAAVAIDGVPVELLCACGKPQHVAAFASGPGMARLGAVLRQRRGRDWDASVLGARLAGGEPFEAALVDALDAGDPLAGELLDAATKPVADVVRTALCLDPEIDLVALTGGVVTGLGERYRAALLAHLVREGLYLTSDREPGWVRDRVVVSEANGLVGAGLAALAAEAA
ncbi:ROK family protein [Dactylosporangium sp. NPDC051485]|uniref:ROK family protein n=1 Tax=Dactylosporangium sp. NPDC051485 TaxID=3154846 RepID=UPI00341BC164